MSLTYAYQEPMRGLHTESAWSQGAAAFHRGEYVSSNPYQNNYSCDPSSLDYAGWSNGWRYARERDFNARHKGAT